MSEQDTSKSQRISNLKWLAFSEQQEKLQSYGSPMIQDQNLGQATLVYLHGLKPKIKAQIEAAKKTDLMAVLYNILQAGIVPRPDHVNINAYYSKKDDEVKLSWSISYQGKVDLLLGSGEVSAIFVDVHHQNDAFDIRLGSSPYVHHIPCFGDRGEMQGVYGVITHNSGMQQIHWMGMEEVERCRAASQSGSDEAQENYKKYNRNEPPTGPWIDFYDQMAKKSLFHEIVKWCRLSPTLTRQLRSDFGEYDFSLLDRQPKAAASKMFPMPKPKEHSPKVSVMPTAEPDASTEDQPEEKPTELPKSTAKKKVKLNQRKKAEPAKSPEPQEQDPTDDDLSLPEDSGTVEDMPPPEEVDEDLIEDDLNYEDTKEPEPEPMDIPDLPEGCTPYLPDDNGIVDEAIVTLREKAAKLHAGITYQLCAYALDKYGVPYWEMMPAATLQRIASKEMAEKIRESIIKFTAEKVSDDEQTLRPLTDKEREMAVKAATLITNKWLSK